LIKVSVFYPNKPGSHFDVDYYTKTHMPMALRLLGSALKGVSVEIGVSGAAPDLAPPFWAIAGFTCDSVQAFTEAFLPHAAELQGDIPKYTDVVPAFQISEVSQMNIPGSL
jgi:uncharacterized protein (TIGR02118 family)